MIDFQNRPEPHSWEKVPTLAEAVGDWIAEEILNLRLRPGQRLKEVEIAEALGVSRQPVREALRVLAEQGLLVLIPRSGAVVAQFDPGYIQEIYEVRAVLESWVLARAAENIPEDEVAALMKRLDAVRERGGDAVDPAVYDETWEIRKVLFSHCGNSFALQTSVEMHTRLRNFPNVLRVDPEFFGIHTDHLAAVLDACLRRDSATAARLQYDYLVSMGDRLAKVLRAQMESLEKG